MNLKSVKKKDADKKCKEGLNIHIKHARKGKSVAENWNKVEESVIKSAKTATTNVKE